MDISTYVSHAVPAEYFPAGTDEFRAMVHGLIAPIPGVVHYACIGTDRSTGDALGPMVGEFLIEMGVDPEHVTGTLDDPLHALNLAAYDPPAPLIAIDAGIGPSIGKASAYMGGVVPGIGVGRHEIPRLGRVGITGVVALEPASLCTQRLSLVRGMAWNIADAIVAARGVTK